MIKHTYPFKTARLASLALGFVCAGALTGCTATSLDDWSDYATPACGALFMAEADYGEETGSPAPALAELALGFYQAGQRILSMDAASMQTFGAEFEQEYLEELRETDGKGGIDYDDARAECLEFGALLPETKDLLP